MSFHNERRVKVETYCRICPCIRRWRNRWRCFGDFTLGIFSLMFTVQDEWAIRMKERLRTELRLTPEQVAKVSPIVDKTAAQLREIPA